MYSDPMATPLRVGFNARGLCDPKIRGFNRHLLGLITALRRVERSVEIHLFTDRPLAPAHAPSLSGCRIHVSNTRPHIVWEQAILPMEAARRRIQILHAPANIGVPAISAGAFKRVVTLHDMITVRQWKTGLQSRSLPALGTELKWKVGFSVSWWSVRSADAVITVSQHSKQEILTQHPEWAKKIHVIPNGVETRFSTGPANPVILARYALASKYVLYVGGFESRKNVSLLARAVPEGLTLVLAGERLEADENPSGYTAELKETFKDVPNVKWLGYVPDADLVHLYRGAVCTVIPSRDEGFGLQMIESMASGTPVLSSHAASLPEVGGDAAAYFDPVNREELRNLLLKAAQDTEWLNDLRQRGLERARSFSWDNVARGTLAVYRSLL